MMTSRKLDAAVAEVLGYEVKLKPRPSGRYSPCILYKGKWRRLPEYSKRGNYMLELEREAKRERLYLGIVIENDCVFAVFFDEIELRHDSMGELISDAYFLGKMLKGKDMPEAVAKAFYKAKTGKEWQDD